MERVTALTERAYVTQVGQARDATYLTAQAPRTVSVGVTATPLIAKYRNAQTAFRGGWAPRVTTLACTGARCVEFAYASRVTSVTVVSWSAPGEERARMENACAIQTASKDG